MRSAALVLLVVLDLCGYVGSRFLSAYWIEQGKAK